MKEIPGQMSLFDYMSPAQEYYFDTGKTTYWQDSQGKPYQWWKNKGPVCSFSGHTCNKQNLWEVADTLDDLMCPHVCCRKCNTRLCGARCNGSEEPKHIPPVDRYLRHGPHTLIAKVREETKAWLDQNGVPDFVKWDKNSLPCQNCTWYDGSSCRSGGHTCHYEYGYLICDGFYQSIVERKSSTVGK